MKPGRSLRSPAPACAIRDVVWPLRPAHRADRAPTLFKGHSCPKASPRPHNGLQRRSPRLASRPFTFSYEDAMTILELASGPLKIDATALRADRQALSAKAREIARGRDALFHGTRYRGLILASGFLKAAEVGANCVSFSRSPEVAAFSAILPREDDDRSGAILIFDRASLKTRYKLECHADGWRRDGRIVDEFEERVYVRDVEIGSHLIGLVTAPKASLTSKARAFRRAAALRLARKAADCSCGKRWKTCDECKQEQFEKAAEQLERTHPGISEWWCDLADLSTLKTPGGDREMVEFLPWSSSMTNRPCSPPSNWRWRPAPRRRLISWTCCTAWSTGSQRTRLR